MDQNQIIATHHQHRMDRTQAPLWHEDDFVSGHVQTAIQYWKETILTTHPQRDEFLGYIGGVCLSEFIDPVSAGIFEGSQFKEADVTPIELPNHVPTSHNGWVKTEIKSLEQKGSLAAWSAVADTKAQPRPRICLPLGVEPNKPRFIWDARYLNSMCKHSLFKMDGVGKSHNALGKGHNRSHWTISRVFTMSRWLSNPGSTSGCAGEEYTAFRRYCVPNGVPPRTYTTALATW